MEIVHIIEASSAGVGKHVVDLALTQHARGHKVRVIYSGLRTDALFERFLETAAKESLPTFRLDMEREPGPSDLKFVKAVKGLLKELKTVEIVHGHSSKGGAIARLAGSSLGLKVCYTPNALITMNPTLSGKKRKIFAAVEKFLGTKTDALIAVSPEELEHAAGLGIPRSKLHWVPNGIKPIDRSLRAAARAQFGVKDDDIVVGFIGRFTEQKAPEYMIQVFAKVKKQHPSAFLALVGAGPLQAEVDAVIAQTGIQDRLNMLGEANGPAMIPGFDIFVMTSRYEGHPYVSMEAVSGGLPVVATEVGGIREVVKDGVNGYVLPVGDVDGLADRLGKLLGDPALRAQMAAKADEFAPGFSLETMVDRTMKIYEHVLGK